MKAEIGETLSGRTYIILEAETLEEGALLVRVGLFSKKDVSLEIEAHEKTIQAMVQAKHHRRASNTVRASRW